MTTNNKDEPVFHVFKWLREATPPDEMTSICIHVGAGASLRTYKLQIGRAELGKPDKMIHHVVEYKMAMDDFGLPPKHLVLNFHRTLNIHHRSKWLSLRNAMDVPNQNFTMAHFDDLVRSWISIVASSATRADACAQLHSMKKPITQSVHAFVDRLQELNTLLVYLPGDPHSHLSQTDILIALHQAMPVSWRNHFENTGRRPETTPINKLTDFHAQMELRAEKRMLENNLKQARNSKEKCRHPKSERNSLKSHSGGNQNKGSQHSNAFQVPGHAKCPVHPNGKHTWAQCHFNPENKGKSSQGRTKPDGKHKRHFEHAHSNKKPKIGLSSMEIDNGSESGFQEDSSDSSNE